jgi:response regulator receiver domain-containing protein
MTNTFQSLSTQIADDFIQSVVFIDDKAYSGVDETDNQHDFDVQEITKLFARSKKICSVFQPENESDITLFSDMAIKADVTVLDWQIIIQDHIDTSNASGEEDADEDDIRGIYTKRIISHLLSSESKQNSLKLILIYTGDTDLAGIAQDILEHLVGKNISDFSICSDDVCCVQSTSCKILVRAKSNGGAERGRHNPALQDKQIPYDDLPAFITDEFAKMTNGLLPNFAMQSLSVIRENFFQIINLFSKKLDAAYLTHKSLLPNINDANELLVELLGDTFTSILRAKSLNKSIDTETIKKWIEEYIVEEERAKLSNKGNETKVTFLRSKQLLKSILKDSDNVEEKFIYELANAGIKNGKSVYKKYAFSLFHPKGSNDSFNIDFAKLCQHKDLIKYDDHMPILTLGTVVRSTLGARKYYVCIQQRCDSVRVTEDCRRFLFLPLSEVDNGKKFEFLTPDGCKLKIDNDTYSLRTIKFSGTPSGTVIASNRADGIYFEPTYHPGSSEEKLQYIVELKELYSQRIVEKYTSNLSRVGLDEPEWVRLS